jgi:hypothetical protein
MLHIRQALHLTQCFVGCCLQTNATMKLVSYTRSGIVFALEVTNDMGITGQGITVTHAWRDTPAVSGLVTWRV